MQARLSRSPGGFSAASVGSRDESEEEDEGPNVEDLRTIPTGARLEVSAAVKEGAVAVPLHIRECGYPFHVRTDTNWHAVQTPPDTKSARTLCEPPHEGCVLDPTPYGPIATFVSVRVRGARHHRSEHAVNYDAVVVETMESRKEHLVRRRANVPARGEC